MNISFRPLGKVRDIVLSTGLDISYAYEDLVFSDHSLFILRFDQEKEDTLHLYFNADCNPTEAAVMENRLVKAGHIGEFNINHAGSFKISQKGEKEELQIEFLT